MRIVDPEEELSVEGSFVSGGGEDSGLSVGEYGGLSVDEPGGFSVESVVSGGGEHGGDGGWSVDGERRSIILSWVSMPPLNLDGDASSRLVS